MNQDLRNSTLMSNIAGNFVRAGQHRPLVSPANAVLKAQEVNLHNNLMQTQEARMKQQMTQEELAAKERAANDAILTGPGTDEQKIAALKARGAHKVAQDLQENLWERDKAQREAEDYASPTRGFTPAYTQFLKSNNLQPSAEAYSQYTQLANAKAKAGATSITVGGEGEPEWGKVNRTVVESFLPRREEAIGTAGSLEKIIDSEKIINNEDIIAGKFGDFRLGFAKLANLAGANNDELITNTETFFSSMGNQTAEIIKAFGAGTGLSDADREYAQGIAGGSITQSASAIKRLVKMAKKAYRYKLKKYNEDAEYLHSKDPDDNLMIDFRVGYKDKDEPSGTSSVVDDLVNKYRSQ